MLAVAGARVFPNLLLSHSPWLQSAQHAAWRALSSRSGPPLSLFVCAVDEESDRAGAALVTALKQLSGREVQLHGVGGAQLCELGLRSVVSEEQLQQLAAAEVIPPTYKIFKDASDISRHSYAKIFRDAGIWDTAIDGCRGRDPPQQQQQQQQQAAKGSSGSSPTSSSPSSSSSSVGKQLCYDAVLTVGSPTASQLTLTGLRQAAKMGKAKLPVLVQYMVPGLWDRSTSPAAAAARWSSLVDHVLCSLPFEPPLLHAAGVPSTFVGHPLLQQLLGGAGSSSSSSTQSFGGKGRTLTELLKQQQQPQQQQPQQQRRQQQQQGLDLFAAGNAAAFWRQYEAAQALQQQAAAAEAAAAAAAAQDSSSSSSRPSSPQPRSKRVNTPAAAAATTSAPQQQQQRQQQRQQQQQRQWRLLALLPGTTEAEVISSLPAFDQITQQLLEQQQQQQQGSEELIATLHVPDTLVQAAALAAANFKVPVLVVACGERLAADALAAAAAAVSHPGPASLQAVAAGVPLVCVRGEVSGLREAWARWRRGQLLPFGSVPNLLLGREGVPEVNAWERGAVEGAVATLQQLLHSSSTTSSGSAAAAAGGEHSVWQQQRAVLQEVLLKLVPPGHQQQQQQQKQSLSSRAASSSSSSWQLPGEAAARTLLELIELRQQQERANSSSSGGGGSAVGQKGGNGAPAAPAAAAAC